MASGQNKRVCLAVKVVIKQQCQALTPRQVKLLSCYKQGSSIDRIGWPTGYGRAR